MIVVHLSVKFVATKILNTLAIETENHTAGNV